MSAVLSLCQPQRIKASHRRRWKGTTGHRLYIMNNPLSGTDPTGYFVGCDEEGNACPPEEPEPPRESASQKRFSAACAPTCTGVSNGTANFSGGDNGSVRQTQVNGSAVSGNSSASTASAETNKADLHKYYKIKMKAPMSDQDEQKLKPFFGKNAGDILLSEPGESLVSFLRRIGPEFDRLRDETGSEFTSYLGYSVGKEQFRVKLETQGLPNLSYPTENKIPGFIRIDTIHNHGAERENTREIRQSILNFITKYGGSISEQQDLRTTYYDPLLKRGQNVVPGGLSNGFSDQDKKSPKAWMQTQDGRFIHHKGGNEDLMVKF